MRIEGAKTGLLMLLAVFCPVMARAQSGVVGEPLKTARANAIRVIRDPHTAACWLLQRDPARPGGPGRMVLLSAKDGFQLESVKLEPASLESANAVGGTSNGALKVNRILPAPVVRSGDRLIVEESSALVEARLEAVALGSAVEGAEFRARLAIGGKIVRVVATGHGRATLAADAGRPR